MLIRKYLPKGKYTKVDNRVFLNMNISDGAIRLYGYLASLRTGQNFTDGYVTKAMQISQRVLTKRKNELKKEGLIMTDRVGAKNYVLYIGYMGMPASKVKELWDKIDEGKEEELNG